MRALSSLHWGLLFAGACLLPGCPLWDEPGGDTEPAEGDSTNATTTTSAEEPPPGTCHLPTGLACPPGVLQGTLPGWVGAGSAARGDSMSFIAYRMLPDGSADFLAGQFLGLLSFSTGQILWTVPLEESCASPAGSMSTTGPLPSLRTPIDSNT